MVNDRFPLLFTVGDSVLLMDNSVDCSSFDSWSPGAEDTELASESFSSTWPEAGTEAPSADLEDEQPAPMTQRRWSKSCTLTVFLS
jgi:hypothetical protein